MGAVACNFRRLGLVGAAGAAALGAGCASSNLTDNATVTSQVAEGLPVGTPAPSMIARAIWFPKASGAATANDSPLEHATGVLALAGDKLWFLEWNEMLRAYDVRQSIAFLQANRISVAHFGSSAMLVIESGNLSFDAFELMRGGSLVSDPETTEAFCAKLQDLRAKNPPPDY